MEEFIELRHGKPSPIPVCLWFIAKTKANGKFVNRRGKTLFIDARKLGALVDRVHRDLTDEEIARIAGTYHAWRGEKGASTYRDIPGFCNSATLEEIRQYKHVLTPGRYVGAEEARDDNEPFEAKMIRLTSELRGEFKRSAELEVAIETRLRGIGF